MRHIVEAAIERVITGQNEFTCTALKAACDDLCTGDMELQKLYRTFAYPNTPEWWNKSGELRDRNTAMRWQRERIKFLTRFKESLP